LQQNDVVIGKANFDASLVAARFQRSASREYADCLGPETLKDIVNRPAEALPVSEQNTTVAIPTPSPAS
jgi:hypothetical protein